jgi:acyl-CoA thioesterase I
MIFYIRGFPSVLQQPESRSMAGVIGDHYVGTLRRRLNMTHCRSSKRMLAWCLCFFPLLASCGSDDDTKSTEPVPAVTTAKIMPLGDSITESAAGMPTYRYFLWHLAKDAGYRIDFVGSMQGAHGGPPSNTDFDMHHEGHWGWRADEVLARLPEWAAAVSPDVVLLHIGHNDLCQDQDIDSTVNEVSAIIDVLRAENPNVAIVLAQNIASAWSCHERMSEFIARLPALVAAKSTEESRISLVDQHTGFDPASMTWDGQHPNATGESQMADRWFRQLRPLLDERFSRSP